jgi:hypothetical protein
LYDLQFWHVRRIIRGYRKRDTLKHQLLAEVVYASIHVMRDAKGKTVQDMFPMLWEKDDDEDECPDLSQYTDEYIAECQEMMKDYKFG